MNFTKFVYNFSFYFGAPIASLPLLVMLFIMPWSYREEIWAVSLTNWIGSWAKLWIIGIGLTFFIINMLTYRKEEQEEVRS